MGPPRGLAPRVPTGPTMTTRIASINHWLKRLA